LLQQLALTVVDQIDKKSLEISQADDDVYTKMTELADELPDNSPRFVLLSYPLTMVCSHAQET
jgi:dsDNA-binding SOS-regulon protein